MRKNRLILLIIVLFLLPNVASAFSSQLAEKVFFQIGRFRLFLGDTTKVEALKMFGKPESTVVANNGAATELVFFSGHLKLRFLEGESRLMRIDFHPTVDDVFSGSFSITALTQRNDLIDNLTREKAPYSVGADGTVSVSLISLGSRRAAGLLNVFYGPNGRIHTLTYVLTP